MHTQAKARICPILAHHHRSPNPTLPAADASSQGWKWRGGPETPGMASGPGQVGRPEKPPLGAPGASLARVIVFLGGLTPLAARETPHSDPLSISKELTTMETRPDNGTIGRTVTLTGRFLRRPAMISASPLCSISKYQELSRS